jgi:hypothetical protein
VISPTNFLKQPKSAYKPMPSTSASQQPPQPPSRPTPPSSPHPPPTHLSGMMLMNSPPPAIHPYACGRVRAAGTGSRGMPSYPTLKAHASNSKEVASKLPSPCGQQPMKQQYIQELRQRAQPKQHHKQLQYNTIQPAITIQYTSI